MKSYFLLILVLVSIAFDGDAALQRRAAVDVGSGGTKVAIADVDDETHQILEIVYENSFPVSYQAALDRSSDGTFDQEIQELGCRTFREIKEIADQHGVEKIVAIATSAFRQANNAEEFVSKIREESGIDVKVIAQKEEGAIAFFSALSTGEFDPDEVVVWDIGTGSLQITTTNGQQGLTVYMGEQMGSVPFKNYIISALQGRDPDSVRSPNPISEEELKMADGYARAFGRRAYSVIKEKVQNGGTVVGIGRLFYNSIRPLASEGGVITRAKLRSFVQQALDKTDEQLNDPFAHVDVSNCILALAVMKALHIQEVYPVETTTTKGLLVAPLYW